MPEAGGLCGPAAPPVGAKSSHHHQRGEALARGNAMMDGMSGRQPTHLGGFDHREDVARAGNAAVDQ